MVPPGTASGTDLWELSQEILPTTALPLLVTSVTSAQEIAAWSIPSRESAELSQLTRCWWGPLSPDSACWGSKRILNWRISHGGGGQLTIPLKISLVLPWGLVSHILRDK